MYGIDDIRTVVDNPLRIHGEFRKIVEKVNVWFHNRSENTGIRVTEKDWDNLLILDACRWDYFQDNNTLPGNAKPVWSRGSSSLEFIRENFVGNELHDTVYVTANPYYTELEDQNFYKVINLLTEWDEETQTVLPETVGNATVEAIEKYPNKRIIAHFMQPHFPFIGELGQKIEHHGYKSALSDSSRVYSCWEVLKYHHSGYEYSPEIIRNAYYENHEVIIKYIADLLPRLDGKTVITSDHGNMVGEQMRPLPIKNYGHTTGLRTIGLRQVPWVEIPSETRRKIKSEAPSTDTTINEPSNLEEKLSALGYR